MFLFFLFFFFSSCLSRPVHELLRGSSSLSYFFLVISTQVSSLVIVHPPFFLHTPTILVFYTDFSLNIFKCVVCEVIFLYRYFNVQNVVYKDIYIVPNCSFICIYSLNVVISKLAFCNENVIIRTTYMNTE